MNRVLSYVLLFAISLNTFSEDNFSGPYVGLKAGHGKYQNQGNGTYKDDGFGQPANLSNIWNDVSKENNTNKAFGAIEAGYNWQNEKIVYGLVFDFSFIDSSSDSSGTRSNFQDNSPLISGQQMTGNTYSFNRKDKMEWLSTFRGKLGYEVFEFLPYATAGVAFSKIKNLHQNVTCCPSLYENDVNSIQVGWSVGAGLSKKLNESLIITLEGLYTEFPDRKGSYGNAIDYNGNPLVAVRSPYKIENSLSSITLGINYQF